MQYVEKDCFFEVNGKQFWTGGSTVNPYFCIGYLGKNDVLTDWHGKQIGTYKITSSWKTPRSYVSSTMNQVEAVVDGITYTGRSAGIGMYFKGKRKK